MSMIELQNIKPIIPNLEPKFEYNRLVIIGNGFDLGLGLKTSYNDFVLGHIKEVLRKTVELGKYDSELITGSTSFNFGQVTKDKIYSKIEATNQISDLVSSFQHEINFNYKTGFIQNIFENYQVNNWVDIETLYFKNLHKEYNSFRDKEFDKKDYSKVAELNISMDFIEKALANYVKEEQAKRSISYLTSHYKSLIDSFFEPINKKENILIPEHRSKQKPKTVIFVNFNYTDSLSKLLNNSFVGENKIIHIHGSVNDNSNPIIFGFGDDTNPIYSALEEEDEDELLRKIKSFAYPKTNNYHKLLNSLDTLPFEVFVVGHSCGISDKTMLSTVFQHKKCLAIKNFHYQGEEEDFYKRIAISRHFSNKPLMRKRVLPFDKDAIIPQKSN
jgi:hypothetical protein